MSNRKKLARKNRPKPKESKGFWRQNLYKIVLPVAGLALAAGVYAAIALPGGGSSESDLERAISTTNQHINQCDENITSYFQTNQGTVDCDPIFQDMYKQLNDIGVINSEPNDFKGSNNQFKQYLAGKGIVMVMDELTLPDGTNIQDFLARYELGREIKTFETDKGSISIPVVTVGESVIKSYAERKAFLTKGTFDFSGVLLDGSIYINRSSFEDRADSKWEMYSSAEDIDSYKIQLKDHIKSFARGHNLREFYDSLSDLLQIKEWQDLYESSSGKEDFKEKYVAGLIATTEDHEGSHLGDGDGLSSSDRELRAILNQMIKIPDLPEGSSIQGHQQLDAAIGYTYSDSPRYRNAGIDILDCFGRDIDLNRDAFKNNPAMDYTGTNPGDPNRNLLITMMMADLTTADIQRIALSCYNNHFVGSQGNSN
ncbi:MAG: hypothetical protein IH934_05980 [Nanoarchaeota archaeon]|nr:hypothetical protein [Nanoarchaeota archaeon]